MLLGGGVIMGCSGPPGACRSMPAAHDDRLVTLFSNNLLFSKDGLVALHPPPPILGNSWLDAPPPR